jgi:DnaK suppressor protein
VPGTPLSDDERAALRELLEAERQATRARLASLDLSFAEMVAAADLEPPDDEHDPDGTTAYERAQVTSLAAEARVRLAELERALVGVDDEGYGICTACGAAIGWPRLEARPGTTRCVACA